MVTWSVQAVLPAVALAALAISVQAPLVPDALPPAPPAKAWQLVWRDEFDGAALDGSKWVYRPDGRRRDGWWNRWDGYGQDHKIEERAVRVPGTSEGFHDFGVWWGRDDNVFYVGGRETWRTAGGGVSQVPEYMLLSGEVGSWGGDISLAKLPDRFLVDYVRVCDLVDGK
jgi:beta-glucanase (GH16 family)